MAVMTRDSWTDERLDDLNGKVDRLAARTETGFRDLRAELKAQGDADRVELKAQGDGFRAEGNSLRDEIKAQGKGLRADMAVEFRGIRSDIGEVDRSIQQLAFGLVGAVLVGFLATIAAILTLV